MDTYTFTPSQIKNTVVNLGGDYLWEKKGANFTKAFSGPKVPLGILMGLQLTIYDMPDNIPHQKTLIMMTLQAKKFLDESIPEKFRNEVYKNVDMVFQ